MPVAHRCGNVKLVVGCMNVELHSEIKARDINLGDSTQMVR